MPAYGCYTLFTAQPGQRDSLVSHLLTAAAGTERIAECLLYVVNTSPTDPNGVWVTELWTSKEAHDSSLTNEDAKALIKQVLPLLAKPPEQIAVQPVGGKGFSPA